MSLQNKQTINPQENVTERDIWEKIWQRQLGFIEESRYNTHIFLIYIFDLGLLHKPNNYVYIRYNTERERKFNNSISRSGRNKVRKSLSLSLYLSIFLSRSCFTRFLAYSKGWRHRLWKSFCLGTKTTISYIYSKGREKFKVCPISC